MTGRDPLEVVREIDAAFDTGDIGRALSLAAEDLEWDNTGAGVPGLEGVYRGHEGVMDLLGQIVEAFGEYGLTAREYSAAGDRVLVVAREFGRGLASGLILDRPLAILYTVRDGLIVRVSTHADVDEGRRRLAGDA